MSPRWRLRSVWHPRSEYFWLTWASGHAECLLLLLVTLRMSHLSRWKHMFHLPSHYPYRRSFWSIAWSSAVEIGHWQMVSSSIWVWRYAVVAGHWCIGQTILSPMGQSSTSYHQHDTDSFLISQEALDQCVCSTGDPIMGHLVKQAWRSPPHKVYQFPRLKVMRKFTDFSD